VAPTDKLEPSLDGLPDCDCMFVIDGDEKPAVFGGAATVFPRPKVGLCVACCKFVIDGAVNMNVCGGDDATLPRPSVVAGVCSAETENGISLGSLGVAVVGRNEEGCATYSRVGRDDGCRDDDPMEGLSVGDGLDDGPPDR
jgi:hypothetical protein